MDLEHKSSVETDNPAAEEELNDPVLQLMRLNARLEKMEERLLACLELNEARILQALQEILDHVRPPVIH